MSKPLSASSPLLVDYRKGSKNLTLYEPLRSLLVPCPFCSGSIGPSWKLNKSSGVYYNRLPNGKEAKPLCSHCADTGRELSTIPSADVSFTGYASSGPIPIGVEVKSTSDLASSIFTGRFQATQLPAMLNDYDVEGRWILQYGLYRPSPRDGSIQEYREGRADRREGWYTLEIGGRVVPYSYLEKFKMSPSLLELGFKVVRVNSIQEASHWLVDLYREWTKPYHTHKSLNTVDRSRGVEERFRRENNRVNGNELASGFVKGSAQSSFSLPHHDQRLMARLNTISDFPNLGFTRAKAVAAHYQSIVDMILGCRDGDIADIDMEVGGKGRRVKIGDKIANRIKEYVS